jgi:hypothetical protein
MTLITAIQKTQDYLLSYSQIRDPIKPIRATVGLEMLVALQPTRMRYNNAHEAMRSTNDPVNKER